MKLASLLLLFATAGLPAFEVVRNVNTGAPPAEKVVLFAKGAAADSVEIFDNEHCRTTINADGELEARIIGNGAVNCGIRWKPEGARKETFNIADYGHVVITCRMEGSNRTKGNAGPGQRPDNLWFPAALFNAAGEVVGSANLADGTPDGRTPDKTTTIILPTLLFTYFGDHDASQVRGIGFTWSQARATVDRDYRLVIERIALAE